MLNIYLCDDDPYHLSLIQEIIKQEIAQNNYNMSIILSATTPTSILNNIQISKSKINMYFLDVNLNANINGIELANKIRHFDPRAFIVMVSSHPEYIPLTFAYMIEPLAYISKRNISDMKRKISHCLRQAKNRYDNTINKKIYPDYFTVNTKSVTIDFDPKDIYYITISCIPHTLEICSKKELTQVRGSINDSITKLPPNFIKISRETIVNTNYIKEYDKEFRTITLTNDSLFNVSVRKYRELKKTCKVLN